MHTVTYKEAQRRRRPRRASSPDATYTIWDLWHGLLLPSGNDAAAALAGAQRRHEEDRRATCRPSRLGCRRADTTVRNPCGLDADGQVTSAYDLALIARAALDLEDFRTVTKTISYDFPGRLPQGRARTRKTYKIYTQNRLLLHGYKGDGRRQDRLHVDGRRTFWGGRRRAAGTPSS